MQTFLIVLASIFSVVNPAGSALVFLSLTRRASADTRRFLARHGGIAADWDVRPEPLRHLGSDHPRRRRHRRRRCRLEAAQPGQPQRGRDAGGRRQDRLQEHGVLSADASAHHRTGHGPVVISLGFSRTATTTTMMGELFQVAMILLAALVIAVTIYVCFAYADQAERLLGHTGTDIAVRLSAFILLCIGVQIFWTGASELLMSLPAGRPAPLLPGM